MVSGDGMAMPPQFKFLIKIFSLGRARVPTGQAESKRAEQEK